MLALVRVADNWVEAIGVEVPAAGSGEAVVTVPDDSPTHGLLTYDPATGTITSTPATPVRAIVRRLTVFGFMQRFTLQEQEDFQVVLGGRSAIANDGAGEPVPLGARLQARARLLDGLLHAKPHLDPESDTTGAALGILASLGLEVIAPERIAAIHVAVTDAELAKGPDTAVEVEG